MSYPQHLEIAIQCFGVVAFAMPELDKMLCSRWFPPDIFLYPVASYLLILLLLIIIILIIIIRTVTEIN